MRSSTEEERVVGQFITAFESEPHKLSALHLERLNSQQKLALVHEIAIDNKNFPDGDRGTERKHLLLDLLRLDAETLNNTDVSSTGTKTTILQELLSKPVSADKEVITYVIGHGADTETTIVGSRIGKPSALLNSIQTDQRFNDGVGNDLKQAFKHGKKLNDQRLHDTGVAHELGVDIARFNTALEKVQAINHELNAQNFNEEIINATQPLVVEKGHSGEDFALILSREDSLSGLSEGQEERFYTYSEHNSSHGANLKKQSSTSKQSGNDLDVYNPDMEDAPAYTLENSIAIPRRVNAARLNHITSEIAQHYDAYKAAHEASTHFRHRGESDIGEQADQLTNQMREEIRSRLPNLNTIQMLTPIDYPSQTTCLEVVMKQVLEGKLPKDVLTEIKKPLPEMSEAMATFNRTRYRLEPTSLNPLATYRLHKLQITDIPEVTVREFVAPVAKESPTLEDSTHSSITHGSTELSVSVVPSTDSRKLDQLIQTVSGGRTNPTENLGSLDGNVARYVHNTGKYKGKTVFHAIIEGDQSWPNKEILVESMAGKIKESLVRHNVAPERADVYVRELLAYASKPVGIVSQSGGNTVLHKLAGEFNKVCAEEGKNRLSSTEANEMKESMNRIAQTLLTLSPGLQSVQSANGKVPPMIVNPMERDKMVLAVQKDFDAASELEQPTTKRKSIFGFGGGSKTTPQPGIKGGTASDSKMSSLAFNPGKSGGRGGSSDS